jgi:DNA-binding MarR family transcriptional regulator
LSGQSEDAADLPVGRRMEDANIGQLLRFAHGAFAAHWQLAMRGSDLPITPMQAGMLSAIDANEGLTQSALARRLHVEGPTLLQAVDRLEQHGYLRRVRRPDDQRSNTLQLTPLGREVLQGVRAFLPARDALLLGDLSAAEQAMLRSLLARVVTASQQAVRDLQAADPQFPPVLRRRAEPIETTESAAYETLPV